ncbi:MAG: helix-turn-helix domain-containing protein [Desulfovibrionaceae bacterium]|nr:helix-turn-helix domain-containing protein [Desulfovibrionaceae bacterium]
MQKSVQSPAVLESPIMKASDVAMFLKISMTKLYRMTRRGIIPKPRKLGGANVWRRSDIETFAEQIFE